MMMMMMVVLEVKVKQIERGQRRRNARKRRKGQARESTLGMVLSRYRKVWCQYSIYSISYEAVFIQILSNRSLCLHCHSRSSVFHRHSCPLPISCRLSISCQHHTALHTMQLLPILCMSCYASIDGCLPSAFEGLLYRKSRIPSCQVDVSRGIGSSFEHALCLSKSAVRKLATPSTHAWGTHFHLI